MQGHTRTVKPCEDEWREATPCSQRKRIKACAARKCIFHSCVAAAELAELMSSIWQLSRGNSSRRLCRDFVDNWRGRAKNKQLSAGLWLVDFQMMAEDSPVPPHAPRAFQICRVHKGSTVTFQRWKDTPWGVARLLWPEKAQRKTWPGITKPRYSNQHFCQVMADLYPFATVTVPWPSVLQINLRVRTFNMQCLHKKQRFDISKPIVDTSNISTSMLTSLSEVFE